MRGGGSKVAAPIARKLLDYWLITRHVNPILPPTAEELIQINKRKAIAKAKRDKIRDARYEAKARQKAIEQAKIKAEQEAEQKRIEDAKNERAELRKQGYVLPESITRPIVKLTPEQQLQKDAKIKLDTPIRQADKQRNLPLI